MIIYRDLERIESPVYSVKAHDKIINSIDGIGGLGIGNGAPELVTGSRDGKSIINLSIIDLLVNKRSCSLSCMKCGNLRWQAYALYIIKQSLLHEMWIL